MSEQVGNSLSLGLVLDVRASKAASEVGAVGGPVAFCGPKGGSTYSAYFMADGASAHIPLVTAWDCECGTFSLPIILGRWSEWYDMAKSDEKKSEGRKRKEEQRTSNLWNIVTTVFHSDTASVEWIHIYRTTVLELVYFVGLSNVLIYFLDVRRSRIWCIFQPGIGSLRRPVDNNCISVDHI